MVVKVKSKTKTNIKPATNWPFPTTGIAKPKKVTK